MSRRDEIKELSAFLHGVSVATDMQGNMNGGEKFRKAAEWLHVLSGNICGGGQVCCKGGDKCTSSHK